MKLLCPYQVQNQNMNSRQIKYRFVCYQILIPDFKNNNYNQLFILVIPISKTYLKLILRQMKSKIVKGYELKQLLGEGAYSKVYKGFKIDTKQSVAIKVFKDLKKNDAESVKNQVNILRSLDHQNIIRCLDYFQVGNVWYVVFEYCGKGDLQRYMNQQIEQQGRIPEMIAKSFITKILQALLYLHNKKIAHRDLKLANILINDEYDVKIADFGLSKDYEENLLRSYCGTPLIMAPQVLMNQQYTEKCDTWSLGAVGYYLLCSDYPFKGKDHKDLRDNIFKSKGPKYQEKHALSDEAKDFINKCLTVKAKNRPSMQDLQSHPWIQRPITSQIRVQFMKSSMAENGEIVQKIDLAIQSSFHTEIFNIIKINHMTERQISRILKNFDQLYPDEKVFQFLTILLMAEKNEHLKKLKIGLRIGSQYFQIESKNLNILQNHTKHIKQLLQQKILGIRQAIGQFKEEKFLNPDKKLIKFIVDQGHKYMLESEKSIKKLSFLKNLLGFLITKTERCQIQIQYSVSQDTNICNQFFSYLKNMLTKQKITQLINNTEQNIESNDYVKNQLKSQWLIDYQNKTKSVEQSETWSMVGEIVQRALNVREIVDGGLLLEETG